MNFIKNMAFAVKNWWIYLIIGILCIACAIGVFATPASGYATLAVLVAVTMILVGILGIAFVISNRDNIPAWGWDLILPVLTLIAGICLACKPQITAVFFICFLGAAALFKAIETICYAISLSKVEGSGWGWTLILGIIALLLALFLIANPLFTAIFAGTMLTVFLGLTLLFMGISSIATSIQLSKVKGAVKDAEKAVENAAEEIQKTAEELKK